MASFAYTEWLYQMWIAGVNVPEASNDMRVALLMTNTTADTEEDVAFVGTIATLDEYDGASYARQALGTQTATKNTTSNRGVFDAANITFTTLGAGTRQAQAMLVYKHVTNDADSVPAFYIDQGGFPFSGNGGDVTVTWHADGIAYTTN